MPQITTNPSILAAARQAIEVKLQFQGTLVELAPQRGLVVEKPSGGHDFVEGTLRVPQLISLSKVGADDVGESNNDEQAYVRRNYALTGRWNMLIAVGDSWSDSEASYKVETLDQTNGYSTVAEVSGFVKNV